MPLERRGGSESGRVAAGGGGLRAASRVPQPREHLYRIAGCADDRNPRVAQDRVTPGRDIGVDGLEDDRLAVPGCEGGDRLRGRDLAWREPGASDPVVAAEMTRDPDRVGVGSGEADGQGLGEDGRVALDHPGEVERIRDRRPWREKSGERVARRARERGQRESRKTEAIGEDRRVAATVGDERHPVPRERRASAERLRDRPRLGDAVRTQDPGPAKRGGGDAVLAREGAGMGQRGPASRLGPPRLEDHHRFPRGMVADRIHQGAPAPLAHSLEVREDDLRIGIVQAVGDEIDGIEVGRVANRCLPGESEPGRRGAKVEVEEEVAALGDEGDRPGRNLRATKIESCRARVEPRAVRAEQTAAPAADESGELVLVPAAFGIDLAESRRDHHDGRHVPGCTILDHGSHRVAGHDDDREVDRPRNRPHGRKGGPPAHGRGARVHREDVSGKAARDERAIPPPAELRFVLGGADEGDRARPKEGGKSRHAAKA